MRFQVIKLFQVYYKINEQLGILNRLIIDSSDEHTALQKGRFTKPPRLQNSSKR